MAGQTGAPMEAQEAITTTQEVRPRAQRDIILYALLASLTRFIPLPIVDDAAQKRLHKRLIKKISTAYQFNLNDDEFEVLATATVTHHLTKMAMFSAKTILKRIIRKTLLFFYAKEAADSFSLTYTIGYLLDYAFQRGWIEAHSPEQIRTAVDKVCDEVDTSQVNHVVFKILKQSTAATDLIKNYILKLMNGSDGVESAPEESLEQVPDEARDLVERIQTALDLMPPDYFLELRQRLSSELRLEHNAAN